jgi:energy-coupling factor transport system permease protein
MTKLMALALVLLAAFLQPSIVLVVLVLLLLAAGASAGILVPLLRALRIPSLLFGSILVVNALFFPGGHDRLLSLGPLGVTSEGLTFGLISAGRILVAFLASVLFLQTTLADDLLEALVARGANHRIAFVILSAIQMVPRLQARAGDILEAQQARGLVIGGSFVHRIRALVPLVGPVLLSSLIDVRERTFALEARGFGSTRERTAYRLVVDPPLDRAARVVLAAVIVFIIVSAATGLPRL